MDLREARERLAILFENEKKRSEMVMASNERGRRRLRPSTWGSQMCKASFNSLKSQISAVPTKYSKTILPLYRRVIFFGYMIN